MELTLSDTNCKARRQVEATCVDRMVDKMGKLSFGSMLTLTLVHDNVFGVC